MTPRHRLVTAFALVAVATAPALAWNLRGHSRVARSAVELLPDSVPEFFRLGGQTAAHLAVDPDAMKSRDLPQLQASERPEHYLDLELLQGAAPPADRYEYLKLLDEIDVEPSTVGLLPYSITEWTQRLTVAFAEYRRWPNDPDIQTKARIYAGILAHYAGDVCQPLHTSVHHNGRAEPPEFVSPRSGIHLEVDSLFRVLPEDEDGKRMEGLEPRAFSNLWVAVLGQIAESHGHVDRVYELEPQIRDPEVRVASAEVAAFASARYQQAAQFIASLYLTAWEDSGRLELPPWLEYPGLEPMGGSE